MASDPPEGTQVVSQVVAQAWSDAAFQQRLRDDPVATLRAEGVDVTEDLLWLVCRCLGVVIVGLGSWAQIGKGPVLGADSTPCKQAG